MPAGSCNTLFLINTPTLLLLELLLLLLFEFIVGIDKMDPESDPGPDPGPELEPIPELIPDSKLLLVSHLDLFLGTSLLAFALEFVLLFVIFVLIFVLFEVIFMLFVLLVLLDGIFKLFEEIFELIFVILEIFEREIIFEIAKLVVVTFILEVIGTGI